jgi:hypothetical protein
MKMVIGFTICSLALFLPAYAMAEDCKAIQDPVARLVCFDKGAKAPKPKAAATAGDAVTVRAKATVTAKLKDPTSAQFTDMKRAMRPSVKGNPLDTICGLVNAKNSYGSYQGPVRFVYFVDDGEANIASGSSDPTDAMIVANFCK